MPLISADVVYSRTVELVNDLCIDITRVEAPFPRIVPLAPRTTYKMTHAEREGLKELKELFPTPVLLWEVGSRPEFVWHPEVDGEIPY